MNNIKKLFEINSNVKWHSILIAFIFVIFFSLLFVFETSVGELWPTWDITSIKVKNFIESYYIYSWIIVSISTVILFFILNIFTRFIKKWIIYFQLLLLWISLLPWYLFANQLVYHENRYADYAKAIISYIWYPLLVTIEDFIWLFIIFLIIIQIILFLKKIVLWKILKKK
jgi:hypothetical protein